MSALPKRYFTAEEYLLLEERSPYKSQWVAGEIFPMGEGTSEGLFSPGGRAGYPSNMSGAQPNNVRIADLTSHTHPDQSLVLACLDCELPLAEIYERVTFPPSK